MNTTEAHFKYYLVRVLANHKTVIESVKTSAKSLEETTNLGSNIF